MRAGLNWYRGKDTIYLEDIREEYPVTELPCQYPEQEASWLSVYPDLDINALRTFLFVSKLCQDIRQDHRDPDSFGQWSVTFNESSWCSFHNEWCELEDDDE